MRKVGWLNNLFQDMRFGARLLRKNSVVTAAAVLSLGLAIGTCTAAFSLIDALVLRPLPVREPHRLVYVTYGERGSSSFNYPLFMQMRDSAADRARLFAVSFQGRRRAIFDDSGGQEERVYGQWISGDAFSVLGIQPALGRLFTPDDDRTLGAHPVAVISYDFWSLRFRKDPNAIGHWLTMEGRQYQIIGVAQQGFTGVEPGVITDLWAPMTMGYPHIYDPGFHWFRIWARLERGVTQEQLLPVLQAQFIIHRRERSGHFHADEQRERVERFVNERL